MLLRFGNYLKTAKSEWVVSREYLILESEFVCSEIAVKFKIDGIIFLPDVVKESDG